MDRWPWTLEYVAGDGRGTRCGDVLYIVYSDIIICVERIFEINRVPQKHYSVVFL